MKWILLVPGALLPATLATELVRAIGAPRLVHRLVAAGHGPEHQASERSMGAAHWSWLAHAFGHLADPPVTAPYAWRASGGGADPATMECWIAQCTPVHMSIARDHFLVTDLGDAPLQADEAGDLLALANAAAGPSGLRFEARDGQWYLLCDQPLDLDTAALDSVLGQSAHERLPTGSDARRWRILTNEIQMLWHASNVNAAREQRDARAVNGIWIHGGGRWQTLPPTTVGELRSDAISIDDAVLRGWMQSADAKGSAGALPPRDVLSVFRGLFSARAHQAWESWLEALRALEERIEQDHAAALACGASRFELVLCGTRRARTVLLPLRMPWWRWPRSAPRNPGRVLQRWLAEDDDVATSNGTNA